MPARVLGARGQFLRALQVFVTGAETSSSRNERRASPLLLRKSGRPMSVNPTHDKRTKRSKTKVDEFAFGHIRIDGDTYEHDVVLVRGKVNKRRKKPSKRFRDQFGHTPLSLHEDIPWACERLIIGTGMYGNLPVMDDVKREAERRGVELIIRPTALAIEEVNAAERRRTNAILHVTC
jgi:hypothetical protein